MSGKLLIKTVFLAIAAFFLSQPPVHCIVIDKIVGVVNGEPITQSEVARILYPAYQEYKKEYSGQKLEEQMILAQDKVIEQLIEDKLVLSEAKKLGIQVDEREIDEKVNAVKNRFGGEANFRAVLAKENMSLSEIREQIKTDIIKSKVVRQQVGYKVTISPTEVRRYYNANRVEFVEPEQADVENILIRKQNRTDSEARALAEKIRQLLENGEDFEKLAKEYSEGPNANGGGKLGFIKKGEIVEEADKVIFSLNPGEISDIVESSLGYHIFKVLDKKRASEKDFYSAKPEIEQAIYSKKIEKGLLKWLEELKENAYISIR